MASLKSEKLHPVIPVEDDNFPGSVLMKGLEVGGGMKLLQYYYFGKAFCTCSYHETTTEHLFEEQFRHIKLNEFLLLLSAFSPIKGPHMAAPAHKNAFRKELWSKLPGSTENGSLDTGPRRFCRAAHPGCVLVGEGRGELSTADGCGFQFCSKLRVFAYVSFNVKLCLYVFNLL